MWNRAVVATAAVLAILTCGSTVAAQGVRFGAGVGPTFSLESGGGTDFHVMGTAAFGGEAGHPVNFRIDGMLQFRTGSDLFIGSGNVVYNFIVAEDTRIRPYAIGGAGIYADGGTDFGINVGAGANVALGNTPARLFGEARFHAIFANGNTVTQLPITIGLMFGSGP
jgi:hypothetical protein